MPHFTAICLPKKLLTILIGKSKSKIEDFLENELPLVIDQYENQVETICLEVSSAEMLIKVLSWKNPDLYVIHVQEEPCTPAKE